MNSSYKINRIDKCIIIVLIIIQIVMLVAFFGFNYPLSTKDFEPYDGAKVDMGNGLYQITEDKDYVKKVTPGQIGGIVTTLTELITSIILFITVIYSGIRMFLAKRNYKIAKEKSEMEGTLDPESLNMKKIIAEKTFGTYIVVLIVCTLLVQLVEVCRRFAYL